MREQRPFTHILFDLDRTLAYYPLSTADIVTRTFAHLGLALDSFGSADDLASRYDEWWVLLERTTPTVDELRRAAWRHVLAERDPAQLNQIERIASEYGALRSAHGVRLFDGVPDLLCDLRAAGLGLGLLTNGGAGQWQKIRSLGIEPLFDAIAVAGDLDLYKPDPRAFLTLGARLGATPSTSLFVGDSYEMDVLGAIGAGMAAAWVRPDGTATPGTVEPTYAFADILGVREVAL